MDEQQLLGEIEDVIRSMPPRATLRHNNPENLEWLGRVSAVIPAWDSSRAGYIDGHMQNVHDVTARVGGHAITMIIVELQRAQSDLRLKTIGPVSTAIGAGGVYVYFDEVRKIIETASQQVYFVDPYLNAEFVTRYLPHVPQGVEIKMLGKRGIDALKPAVELFCTQNERSVSLRSVSQLHDRYVFTDRAQCYQSGASFKDGARLSPTTLTQIVDAFGPVLQTYEDYWEEGTQHI